MPKPYRCPFLLIALVLLIIVAQACNLPSPDHPPDSEDVTPGLDLSDGGLVAKPGLLDVMALVIDSQGEPISYATLGDGELITTEDGVAVGPVKATEAGWIHVSAPGYMPAHASSLTTLDDTHLLWVTLTPIATGTLYQANTGASLVFGEGEKTNLSVHLDPGLFDGEGIVLSLAPIHLQHLDAHHQPLNADEDLHLQCAFSIEATSTDGMTLSPSGEGKVHVHLPLPEGIDDIPILAYFDPESGSWEPTPGGCALLEERILECELPHFSEFGFFGEGDSEDDAESDEGGFWGALDDHRGGSGEGGSSDGGGSEGGSTTDNIISQAQRIADRTGGETGKIALVISAGIAHRAGMHDLADQMLDQARDIVRNIGEGLLNSTRCETYYKLLKTAEQAQRLGKLEDLATRLIEKARDLKEKCITITGTIEYKFYLHTVWPGAERWTYDRGSQLWTEVHRVIINIDPETGAVDGESQVKVTMPQSIFRVEENSTCGPLRVDKAVENIPDKGTAMLLFKGTYLNDHFSLSPIETAQASPVGMQHVTWYNPTYTSWPECNAYNEETSRNKIADYVSQLVHGFFGKPEPPSLETMLNEGRRTERGEYKILQGQAGILYTRGQNLSPLLPVQAAQVKWEFRLLSTLGGN